MDRYALLVRESLEFFLSRISFSRLRRVLLDGSALLQTEESGARLFQLAVNFPTLHKLCQVIARNPRLDPGMRKWLVGLEHGDYGTAADGQIETILDQLAKLQISVDSIDISPLLIAEASVATVLLFCCWSLPGGGSGKGVFKVLKPAVGEDLREELAVMADTFDFLDQHRKRFGLQAMKFNGLFSEIREDMEREIDLGSEQAHLAEAVAVYGRVEGLRIPHPAPFNTPIMTSMEFIDGKRINDIDLSDRQRLQLARLLFEAVICLPLFLEEEWALFHGDPHAGNILVIPGGASNNLDIALLDWTLAGHLSKQHRLMVMKLLLAIVKNDSRILIEVISSLALTGGEAPDGQKLTSTLGSLLASQKYLACDFLQKAFLLLEAMTFQGLVFPAELMLFRKTFFTLEGVLNDISPGFSMGEALECYLAGLVMQEFPKRYANTIFAVTDGSEQYQSLLSSSDLLELTFHLTFGQWQIMTRMMMQQNTSLLDSQVKLIGGWLDYFFLQPLLVGLKW